MVDQVFEAWRKELTSHRPSAKTRLAQHAVDSLVGSQEGPLLAGAYDEPGGGLSGRLRAARHADAEL